MDYTNTSGIRSPFSPRVRQSITGRRQGLTPKNQSKFMQSEAPAGDVIYKTPLITMETFGHPLPVLVTEALTFASGEVSVQLSPCGYCWLVCGRRLLCWARDGGGSARELTLPQTDLQHRAELVQVFYEDGAQMPSCIGVSPEGVVRYWPSVGQESYVDTSCELAGQECAKLCAASSGLLLATTSCSLLILHPEPSRPAVTCQPLRPPSGWLGGLGRRVSLLFFGSMPANADTKLVGVVVLQDGPLGQSPGSEAPGYVALVGGGGGAVLQLWRGAELFEHNLRRALTDAHSNQGDPSSLQVACVDVCAASPTQLMLLVAVANVARPPDMRHAIAQMSVEDPANPRVTSLLPVRGCALSAECSPRLLPLRAAPLLYAPTYVQTVSTSVPDKVEYIDVGAEGDRILGATLCRGVPWLFSRKHGVLALTPHAWKQKAGPATNIPLGSSSSLQIAAQLRDKQRAFSLFLDFLRAAGLWQRLGTITPEAGGEPVNTVSALGLMAEKLTIAVTLRNKQQGADAQLIDAAIYQVVCGEDAAREDPEVEAALSSGALSPSDVCFRRVSGIGRVLSALAHAHHAHAAHAAHAANLLTSVLTEVHKCRAQWQHRPIGLGGLLPALLSFHHRAVAQYGANCPDLTLRTQLYESTIMLADLILTESAALQNTRPRGADTIQRQVIQPYIDAGQTERAAVLAEKFKDFELLVEMCVRDDKMERLYSYIDKYAAEGIAEIAFSYLTDRGGACTARLVRSLGARYPARLQGWLSGRPGLSAARALHQLAAARPGPAAAALRDAAADERDSVDRLATIASLAKLCLLASDECPAAGLWDKIEGYLSLAEQHAALPRDVKILHGLDQGDCRVNPHEDLAQMYIDCESDALTEYDYKKALDLTDYVEDMERRDDLRLKVWIACIRRSSWAECDTQAPHDELQRKMFFRLMHLVHSLGGDLALLLPPAEDILTARELADLVSDPRFRYIIKYGYECFHAAAREQPLQA